MSPHKIEKVKKRNGSIVDFDESKIAKAIYKAITATGQGDGVKSKRVAGRVVRLINRRFKKDEIPSVEQIQDIVEEVLILEDLVKTAKAYILYREKRREIREAIQVNEEAIDRVDQYIGKLDWEIKENANMAFSLQGLNRYVISYVVKKYWLNKIYPKEIRDANKSGDFHVHNLDTLGLYTFFGREVVVVKLNGVLKLISLKDLYNEIQQIEVLLNKKDQAFAKYPQNLFVLDRNGWTKITRMVQKKKERKMRFIKSEQGQSIIITDNHPFIVKEKKDDIKEKEIDARNVLKKEHLTLSCHIPSLISEEKPFSRKYIYLAEELIKNNHTNFFLEGFEWNDFIKNWGGSLKSLGTLSTSNSANSLNNKLELTEDLGYLVGFFIAEGNYDSWRLSIVNSEKEIIEKIQRICANLGVRSYVCDRGSNVKRISINCGTLKLVFEKVFKIKSLSQNKNLPVDILTYNLDFAKGVIAGIIDGDGSVRKESAQILIRVVSRTMLEQLSILLQFFGIIPRTGASIKDIGKKQIFRGKEITQNYPLYRLSFSKRKHANFPSIKYQKAIATENHWRTEEYGWNKILNNDVTKIADDYIYDITTNSNTFLCNSLLVHNCAGWDLYDFLLKGFSGVSGKIESKPPKHFRSALGQIVNFMFTVTGEVAGAVAFSNFDTLLAPFIRSDGLDYKQVKQSLQEFLFNMAVPTRAGFQCPFSNITLDLKPSPAFAKQSVIIGGKPQEETYGEFQEEMKIFNKALFEVMMEGDKSGRPFSFPIPTINITKDFPWQEPAFNGIFEASAKYGTNYFANYINSDMKPEDVRSMCKLPGTEIIYKNASGEIAKTEIRRIVDDFLLRGNSIEVLINGKFEKVKNVIKLKLENEEILKVVLDNGIIDKMTLDHPSLIIKNGKLKMIESKELKIGNEFPFAKHPYEGKLGDFDIGKLIGLYIGDGWISHDGAALNLVFNSKEKELVKFVQKIAEERFIASNSISLNEEHHFVRISIASRGLVEVVKEYVRGYGSLNKRLNSKIFARSLEFRKGVLIGMIESDGFLHKEKNYIILHLGNKDLILDILTLSRSLGINTTYFESKNSTGDKKKTGYSLRFAGDIPEWLRNYFKMKKGRNLKYRDYDNFYGVKIVKIEKERYTGYVYDFELDNKEHAFQLANGIITHNCCRLRLDLTELYNRGGGGLFGSGSNTGSIGVVTINMPRIGYLAKTKKDFFEKLAELMDLARDSLEIKRKAIEDFADKGLYPYSKFYLASIKKARGAYYNNHFSTIGLVGMNECLLNFIEEDMGSKKGRKFTLEVMDFMREKLVNYQKETGNLYNLEQTPAESTAYRLALKDREKYPDIITAGTKETPYYTNSTQLPVNYTDDVFEALKLQDEIQCRYTGGSVLHLFLGERIHDIESSKRLIRKVFESFSLPYITLTPTFSICPVHGYIAGEHFFCPHCVIKQPCEVYSRVVGYIRPLVQFNAGKLSEWKDRRVFKLKS